LRKLFRISGAKLCVCIRNRGSPVSVMNAVPTTLSHPLVRELIPEMPITLRGAKGLGKV